jgi:hypothetical protein
MRDIGAISVHLINADRVGSARAHHGNFLVHHADALAARRKRLLQFKDIG